jgi:hypothetical protein
LSLWLRTPTLKTGDEDFEYAVRGPLFAASAVLSSSSDSRATNLRTELQASIPFRKKWKRSVVAHFKNGSEIGFDKYSEADNSAEAQINWTLSEQGLVLNEQVVLDKAALQKLNAPILAAPMLIQALCESDQKSKQAYFVAGTHFYILRLEKRADSGEQDAKFTDAINPDWSSAREFGIVWSQEKKAPAAFRVRALPLIGTLEAKLIRVDQH